MAKRIVLAGGGTGGHIFPLIAVARYIKDTYWAQEQVEFLYVGPKGKMEEELFSQENIPQKNILCGKLRRYFSLNNFIDIFRFFIGTIQSLWHLFVFMPDAVFAKGGYASVPVALAARIFRIPVVIHESDAVAGLSNKFLGSIASTVAITFQRSAIDFPPSKTVLTGIPVRAGITQGNVDRARKEFNLPYRGKPVVLFMGGSQGAKLINDTIVSSLPELLDFYQVVHLSGSRHRDELAARAKALGIDADDLNSDYRVVAFADERQMADLYALADAVVCRSGGTSIAELAANKKSVMFIPLSGSANNHQRLNAYEVAKAGGAVVLEEENFKHGLLMHNLDKILNDQEVRNVLQAHIASFFHPNAAQNIANEIVRVAGK
jgi:UDP-N-acetylglucosamine--N-acetylmuramyl-(pentapeptide) pyrophosphoryl-undecaprenol N-acetylglucosamine transferase